MKEKTVLFAWLDPKNSKGIPLPRYHSEHASGMDVAALLEDPVILDPGDSYLFPTGFAVAIPSGYELQVRPRSGLAIKNNITIINSPGTIDADYRGEIRIGLINLGSESFVVNSGDRIAQMVLAPVCRAKLQVVERLNETDRGSGGFGHTGMQG